MSKFNVGDKVIRIADDWLDVCKGCYYTIKENISNSVLLKEVDGCYSENNFNLVEKSSPQSITAISKITLELTGSDLALLYALIGKTNSWAGYNLWIKIKAMLDPDREKYNSVINVKSVEEAINYNSYKKQWEDLLFNNETEEQKQHNKLIKELEETIKKASEQIESLKGNK